MKQTKLMQGDNIESLKKLPDNSIDSVVTDPPYGLSFMNKKWDYDVPSVEFWKEVYRVLKPGGHILSFGGTRTYHRMVVNIEDAGFEIRDQIMWLYGSGFPKSLNVGKAVDKLEGNEREVVGKQTNLAGRNDTLMGDRTDSGAGMFSGVKKEIDITKGTSPFEGWGTALKPANEPICLARKPLSEKSVVENVLKWKTGGINVDGCRVGSESMSYIRNEKDRGVIGFGMNKYESETTEGRFPANIILECICDEVIKGERGEVIKTNRIRKYDTGEERWTGFTKKVEAVDNYGDKGDIHTDPNCPCRLLDEQSGESRSNCKSVVIEGKDANVFNDGEKKTSGHKKKMMVGNYSDKGGASRFFYQAKVSKAERNMGLDGIILQLSNFCVSIDYNNKEIKLWEKKKKKARHQEVMELLTQKDIDELQLKKVMENTICEWNTGSYGNNTMDIYQMVATFTTLMVTNLITELKILNVLIEQNTNENISECILKTEFGGNIVTNVMSGNPKNIIIEQKKDGCQDNVNLVELKQQLKINVKENKNIHATVKPINLMAYLCRLITPEGGICLDPFMGSGSTGVAAQLEGFRFVGMEMDNDYFKIAEARIDNYEKYKKFLK